MVWYNAAIGDSYIMVGPEAQSSQHHEILDPNLVEVRFGDPIVDAPRLRELWTQKTAIEHMAAITPYITEDEIKELYKGDGAVLLTAETPSGLIIETYSIYRPGHGSLVGEGGKLVVDEKYRGLRIVSKLIKAGNAVMFEEGYGEFGTNKSQVYVITGVKDDQIPQRAYEREGYLKDEPNIGCTYSWSNELNKLVLRNSQPMHLYKSAHLQNCSGEYEQFYPKPRPIQLA
ncbi:MAG TPA: hypothetical protein VJK51_05965 [Candidatus Nanoarchaeia archaeon]|nr:hypothetical protein [Candidatus Nanoarchaeia archaeon]